ncbi:MAG TPA: hypothetical protein VL043_04550 [Protaetiibacter sp.]|nr:hypothetical protein [Protaetiibacter sp.]
MSYTTQQHQTLSLLDEVVEAEAGFFSHAAPPPPSALKAAFPPDPQKNPLFDEARWVETRARALEPKHCSELVTTEQDRAEFLEGMRLLRFDGATAKPGVSIQPQQLLIADMLAAGHQRNAVLAPRRVSKSTSPIAVGIGRAAYRDDYRVGVFTLTSGKAGRSRFLKDVAAPIERLYPTKRDRPFRLSRIAGMEGLVFPSGGGIYWLSSIDDITGEAFDMLLLDEAGKPNDPGYVAEVMAAVEPTTDTRPDAQIVVLGTAGEFKAGNLLWDSLELGRNGTGGIVEYAAPDGITDEQLQTWEPTEENPDGRVRELVELTHPGVGTLTTLDTMRQRFESMRNPTKFAREYLSIFGQVGESTGLIDTTKWAEAGTGADLPTPPADFALAFAPHPDQLCGSIVAAWRDKKGRAHVLMLEHKVNVKWMAAELSRLSRKYGRRLVYDGASQVGLNIVEDLTRARPRPRMDPRGLTDVKQGAALLVDEINRGNLTHYRQPELDLAARRVLKRSIGVNGWAFGRGRDYDMDITPLEAAALALLAYDQAKPKSSAKPTITFAA